MQILAPSKDKPISTHRKMQFEELVKENKENLQENVQQTIMDNHQNLSQYNNQSQTAEDPLHGETNQSQIMEVDDVDSASVVCFVGKSRSKRVFNKSSSKKYNDSEPLTKKSHRGPKVQVSPLGLEWMEIIRRSEQLKSQHIAFFGRLLSNHSDYFHQDTLILQRPERIEPVPSVKKNIQILYSNDNEQKGEYGHWFHRTGAGLISRPPTGPRPMTAVRGAGYTSSRQVIFDPLNMGNTSRGPAPPLESRKEDTPEEKIKSAERKIMDLIESSAEAAVGENVRVALERARDASSRERVLIRLQEQAGLSDSHNVDLTLAVLFNLATQYTNNEMYTEAIATYQAITRNRMFSNSARLKVNVGNIYVKIGQLSQAIKMYRMAFDQAPAAQKDLRIKITHNIGMVLVRMGRLEEAVNSFEWVMKERSEFKAGLHAILCHFALSHRDKMKRGFLELVEVQLNVDQEDKYTITTDDVAANILNEVIRNDELSKLEAAMQSEAEKTILTAAKLIAPVIEDTLTAGFAWCVDTMKSSAYSSLAADLEINKAMVFLYNREIGLAIDTLKMFENRDSKANNSASTMLSFINFLQGDYEQAEKYAEAARKVDSYNAAAYVNLSAVAIKRNELDRARELLLCALDSDASHVQALYNLGLVYKRQGWYEEALECFWKLRNIVRYDPQTVYQIGRLYQLIKDMDQAAEWYNQLLTILPSDPGVLQKLGEMYDNLGDRQSAFQHYHDSYRFYPANFEVIDWLGSYYIGMQAFSNNHVRVSNFQGKFALFKGKCTKYLPPLDLIRIATK
ncbi:intraflagellar transport protein 88 homolog [Diachasma alloeum]|uniref:intraflagellar transport protein 88 homolog n=1 Tax=Diachasma alloeum TaxID=454923 RepID=UPI000738238A|nr:intraflagellar transport protein 88 homolog [Diachasma alloeum]